MRYITLSHTLKENSPVHVALKEPEFIQTSQISDGDGYNSFLLILENHSGTHIDAPGHFLENGRIISDYEPDELIFNNPLVLDISKGENELIEISDMLEIDLTDVNCLFFRTGFEKYRKNYSEKYLTGNPGISPGVVYWIRKNFPDVRCLGIDCISISSYKNPKLGVEAHLNAFRENEELGKPLLLIEDMKLNNIKNEDIKSVIVVPWQIEGIDSAPCNVFAKIK